MFFKVEICSVCDVPCKPFFKLFYRFVLSAPEYRLSNDAVNDAGDIVSQPFHGVHIHGYLAIKVQPVDVVRV